MRGRLLHDDVFRRLSASRDFIHASYAESLPLAAMARRAGMSPFHFVREFRRAFGQTPHDYLVGVRIARAKELLLRDARVTDACFDVGFSSLGSFSTLFGRRVGLPPSVWRSEARVLAQVPERLIRRYVPRCYASFFAGV